MRPALLVIDLQHGYFDEPSAKDRLAARLPAVNRLIAGFAARGLPITIVRTEHSADGSTWTLKMRAEGKPVMLTGSDEARDVAGLIVPAKAAHLPKTRRSAFLRTDLAERLRAVGAERIVLAGTALEACITDTARDGVEHDFPVTIARDAVVALDPGSAKARVGFVCAEFGVEVASVDEILAALGNG